MRKFRKPKVDPIVVTWTPIRNVFKPQIAVRAVKDVSGWADKEKKVRWEMRAWRIYYVDERTAREFATKNYVHILEMDEKKVKPVSADEAAEILSTVTTLTPGGANG